LLGIKVAVAAVVLLTGVSQAQDAAAGAVLWPHTKSDLKADPNVTWGRLENGVRYAILPNADPPGRASLRLFVNAGSLMEDDDQQGMAHFLEHMAFNGTRDFPAGEMIEYFQRLGMAFGADTNAHTSFHETVYKLELPKTDTALLETSISLLRNYADGMLLAEPEIDRERGIILSEKLSRDSVGYRTMVEGFKFNLPESKVTQRLPIGLEKTIKTMPRERFVDFYNDYYTPGRLYVVVVGDIEVAPIEKLIKKSFGEMKARPDAPDPDLGKVTVGRGLIAKVHTELEMPYTNISIEANRPYTERADNSLTRFTDLQGGLADTMLSRRFQKLAKQEDSPILQVQVYHGDFLKHVDSSEMRITCKPENWEKALALAEQELRRALKFGFTESELAEAKANVLSSYERQAKSVQTRKSKDLSSAIVSRLAGGDVFTHPSDDLPRVREALEKITPNMCLAEFSKGWDTKDISIFIGGNVEIKGGQKAITSAFNESRKVAVTAPVEEEVAEFAYTEFGEPGVIFQYSVEEDLGVTQIVFDNNVRLNLKPTDFSENSVLVTARIGNGQLSEPTYHPGLAMFADGTFVLGGLGKHSLDELDAILAGRSVGVQFGVGDSAFELGGTTTPDDLELQLQLMCAQITDPGYRPEGQRQFARSIAPLYQQLAHTMEGVMQDKVSRMIHSGDSRFGYPEQSELEARNTKELREWFDAELANSYIELTIVGDFDAEKAIEFVASTFGAIPARDSEKRIPSGRRNVAFPKPQQKEYQFESQIPKAGIVVYWPTHDIWDINRSRRLGLLGDVLGDRLRKKVREELGDAYSPVSYHSPSDVYEDYGYLVAMVTLKPDQAGKVADIVLDLGQELASGKVPITDDEFARARAPRISRLEQMRRDNSYWLGSVLESSQESPQRIEWARTILPDYRAATREEVSELGRTYLQKNRAVVAKILPIVKEGEESEEEE